MGAACALLADGALLEETGQHVHFRPVRGCCLLHLTWGIQANLLLGETAPHGPRQDAAELDLELGGQLLVLLVVGNPHRERH